jgi:uncharacterized protein YyaL (SSP411 family)
MLYDNAGLLALYAEAAGSVDEDEEFAAAAEGIVRWLQRDMRVATGGFASAMDADSEGEEGAFYLWQRDEVAQALDGEPRRDAFLQAYGLASPPNFEHQAWHLQRGEPLQHADDFAAERANLLRRRDARIWPARDDKQLTAWNAMTVRALSRAALRLRKPAWLALADTVLDSLRTQAWRDGRLLAVAGKDTLRGYLDDHAFLLDALLERLQARWDEADVAWARALAATLLDDFEDAGEGGFFFTPHAHEPLPQRPKPWFDEATPSGNGVAARALLRLGFLLGETRWLDAAERTLRAGLAAVRDTPHGACALLAALHEFLQPGAVVILRASAAEAEAWEHAIEAARDGGAAVFVLPPEAPSLADKAHATGGRAYVCSGLRCGPPANAPAELPARLAP